MMKLYFHRKAPLGNGKHLHFRKAPRKHKGTGHKALRKHMHETLRRPCQ